MKAIRLVNGPRHGDRVMVPAYQESFPVIVALDGFIPTKFVYRPDPRLGDGFWSTKPTNSRKTSQ